MRPLKFRGAPKRETLRVRRRRTRTIATAMLAAFFALAAYGVSLASYLPQFSIERIEVNGTNDTRPELVRAFVATRLWDGSLPFFSKSNIFLYPRAEIEAALKESFPRVENVEVSRESLLASAIAVSIEERKAFARWCASSRTAFMVESTDSCFVLDSKGFVFAPASTTPSFETQYVFEGSLPATSSPIGETYLPGRFAGALALLERLGQSGFSPENISVESEQDFTVELSPRLPAGRQGFEIRATFGTDVSSLVKNLELVLASEALRGKEGELEYIDLRFGNRVYYKFKGGAKGEW